MIYGELGAYPMSVYIKLRMVNYWSKLINGKDSKLSLILYKYMYKCILKILMVNTSPLGLIM